MGALGRGKQCESGSWWRCVMAQSTFAPSVMQCSLKMSQRGMRSGGSASLRAAGGSQNPHGSLHTTRKTVRKAQPTLARAHSSCLNGRIVRPSTTIDMILEVERGGASSTHQGIDQITGHMSGGAELPVQLRTTLDGSLTSDIVAL